MTKLKVALKLKSLTVLELLQQAKLIVTKMTGNANFATPDPPLLSITAAVATLQTSNDAVAAAKKTLSEKVAKQELDEQALKDLLTYEGNYVDNRAKGDKVIIESAGMPSSDQGGPVGQLPAPTDFSATAGDMAGEIDLHWDGVKGAKSYTIQLSVDTASLWVPAGTSTKSKFAAQGLVSGRQYWFKVAALGTAGQGAWSDPAVRYAP